MQPSSVRPDADGYWPTFVGVGAPRCGTTSLHYYLRQHPQVCMSAIKEPNYFLFGDGGTEIAEPGIVKKSVRSRAEYRHLFRPTPAQRALGEISPLYLFVPEVPGRIAEACGNVPIIALLRSPAERAWSHYLYARPENATVEPLAEFASLVRAEMSSPDESAPYRTRTHLVRLGRYDAQVERYHREFGADQVLCLLSEELSDDPVPTLARVCRHIGVDDRFNFPDTAHYNASGAPRSSVGAAFRRLTRAVQPTVKALLPARAAGQLGALRTKVEHRSLEPFESLDDDLRREINDWCRPDIERLATRLDRDLSAWFD